jgi:two-component system chemotaxis response regulator CheY
MTLNVLIVDDSETMRAVIVKALKIAEVPINEIHEAANGKEALEILEKKWVDAVLTDINMPVMGGVEMIEQMSRDGLLKTIPVIVVSTVGSASLAEELKAKGIRAFIRKPFTPEQIKSVMAEILEGQNV